MELSGDPDFEYSLHQAYKLSERFPESEFMLLHAPGHTEVIVGLPHGNAYETLRTEVDEAAQDYCGAVLDSFKKRHEAVELLVRYYSDVQGLYEIAKEQNCDFLVVNGEGRRGALGRWVYGDRGLKLLRMSDLPVLISPPVARNSDPTFSPVGQTVVPKAPTSDLSIDELGLLFPPYRSREQEASFFANRAKVSGHAVGAVSPVGALLLQDLEEEGLRVETFATPEELEAAGAKDSILFPWTATSVMLETSHQVSWLKAAKEALRPGGLLLFDLYNPWLQRPVDSVQVSRDSDLEEAVRLEDGREVRRHVRVRERDYLRQIQQIDFVYWVESERGQIAPLTKSFASRFYGRFEIEYLLQQQGFEVESILGSRFPGELSVVARSES